MLEKELMEIYISVFTGSIGSIIIILKTQK